MQREIAEVHDGVWQMTVDHGRLRAWSYLIDAAEGELILYDLEGIAGVAHLTSVLKKIGRQPSELRVLILSHSHHLNKAKLRSLHAFANCKVLACLQGRQIMAPAAAPAAAGGDVPVDFSGDAGMIDWLEFFPFKLPFGREMQIVHTPGHSPDGISLSLSQERVLMCGEAFVGPGPADYLPLYTNVQDYRNTLRWVAEQAPEKLLTARYGVIEGRRVPAAVDQALRMVQHIEDFIAESISKIDHDITIEQLILMLSARFGRKAPVGFSDTVRAHLELLRTGRRS
ncbi:MAG TPA: hypothetical protein ENJ29_00040 [Bacteroidetes bacterium]|nr:hypothetical protein [Bacteroidota bacterium]